MATPVEEFAEALTRHGDGFDIQLSAEHVGRLNAYYALLLKWNPRLHLVAPCSAEEFAVRHVLESLMLIKHLPLNSSVIDIGSGAGLPIIPCLLVRDDLRATLIESSRKKAEFLREALRAVNLKSRFQLVVRRFEEMTAPEAEFLTCRALDRFGKLLPKIFGWARPGTMFLLFGGGSLREQIRSRLTSVTVVRIPESEKRFLVIGHREI